MGELSTESKGKEACFKVIRTDAAGIDIGSRMHYVAVGPEICEQNVRSFGCFTPDLHEMAKWLKDCGIRTVAMESTGVYWIPVVEILEQHGIETLLVDARYMSHVPGKKTDVVDCQWIQQLHSCGLLRGAFRPSDMIVTLRSYWRHRASLVESCSRTINIMQKSLEQMNIQIHKVLSDISGMSGMNIIRAIVSGERDAFVLAKLKHPSVKSSEDIIVKSLSGNFRQEHVFVLKQVLEEYDFYQNRIAECDSEIEKYISTFAGKGVSVEKAVLYRRKNQVHFDVSSELKRITGVDLTKIDGISALTAMTVISEYGIDLRAFPTEKHFASHMGLSPNHIKSGGHIQKKRTKRVKSRTAKALRLAAQSLHKSKSALGAFYRRMRGRHGSAKAITATAHKLAKLIFRMLRYGEDYVDKGQEYYEQKYKERLEYNLRKNAKNLGFQLVPLLQ